MTKAFWQACLQIIEAIPVGTAPALVAVLELVPTVAPEEAAAAVEEEAEAEETMAAGVPVGVGEGEISAVLDLVTPAGEVAAAATEVEGEGEALVAVPQVAVVLSARQPANVANAFFQQIASSSQR